MNPRAGWTPDPEGAAAKLQAVHDRLTAAIADLTRGPAWQQMLQTAARFHHYSPNNVLLITSQCPQASAVAGFGTWKQLGRQVRKGQSGIAILAPVLRRPATNPSDPLRRASGAAPGAAAAGERGQVAGCGDAAAPVSPASHDLPSSQPGPRISGFRVVHVFDLSQTDGPDLPTGPAPQLLDGAAPPGLFDGLAQQVRAEGFELIRHDVNIPHHGVQNGTGTDSGRPNGVTDYVAHTVTVRLNLTEAQSTKTLAHELGHVLLHRPQARPEGLNRPRAEIEAESVAYLVTAAHGLAADDYTVPYVTGWSGGDLTLLQQTAERVLSTAQLILQRTPPPSAFARPEPAGADRRLQRTTSREALPGISRDVGRDVGRDREPDGRRSLLVSQDLDNPAAPVSGPPSPSCEYVAADQAGLW